MELSSLRYIFAFTLGFMTCVVSGTISFIGFDLLKAQATFSQSGLTSTNETVYMLPTAVNNSGILFAFSVIIFNNYPVIFQLYRPKDGNNYMLLAELLFTPSRQRGRENVYIESLLGQRCIGVQPGDRLALLFHSTPPSVVYEFDANNKVNIYRPPSSAFSIGSLATFDTLGLPYSFYAEAFVYTDTSNLLNNSTSSDCIMGMTIPQNQIIQPVLSTIMPITGAPGDTGYMGSTGPTGVIGSSGQLGPAGWTGGTGQMGVIGKTGLQGATGQQGFAAATGVIGGTGGIGNTGIFGSVGDIGGTGPTGPPGLPGQNLIINMNQPDADTDPTSSFFTESNQSLFWMTSRAIWSIYIWLAIVSFILLIVLIVTVVFCCIHSSTTDFKRQKLSMSDKNSTHGSSDNIISS